MGMFEAPKNELGGVFFKGDVNSTPYVLFRSLISFCAQSIASSKEIEKYRRMANFDGALTSDDTTEQFASGKGL